MKILALANCNGLVIKQVLASIGHEVDHIVPTAQTAETVSEETIRQYDVILAQGVQRRLPELWDRVSAHPRCLVFPYIVFNGFTPDRLALVPKSPAAGGGWGNIPRIMATAWKNGLPQAETCRLYNPEFLDLMGYRSEFSALKQLFLKDLSRNLTNPEAQFARWFDRGVFFFTGNHPRSFVVEDILRSILEPLELKLPAACLTDLLPDPLAANDQMPSLNHPMATNRLDRPDQIYKVGPRLRTLPEMVAGIYHRLQKAGDAVEIPQRDLERFDTALREWSDRKPEPTTNPYTKIPAHRFWSRSVARLSPADVSPGHDLTPIIEAKSRVATAGSCFAQHVAKALVKSGLTYYVAEPAPEGMDKETADARGYGLFSARYGNIYSTRQLRQLVDRAYGRFTPIETAWRVKDGYIDPFRPNIGETFASVAAVETARETHMAHVRQMLETLDVFVFTLGLTEGWFDRRDGAAFPVTPGSVTSAADPANFEFQNPGYAEVKDDLLIFLAALERINPKARVIFTVSPVPLIATYSETDALSATSYSKSVLRTAAEDVSKQFHNVQYFPSFEIITGAYNRGAYFAPDLRQVTPDGVAHVMRVFLKRLVRGSTGAGDDTPLEAKGIHSARMNAMMEELSEQKAIICDEELHEKDEWRMTAHPENQASSEKYKTKSSSSNECPKASKKIAVNLLGRRRVDAIYNRVWNRFGAKFRHRETHDIGVVPKTSEIASTLPADTLVLCDFGCVGAGSIQVQTDTNMPVIRVEKPSEEIVSGAPGMARDVPLGKGSKIIVFLCDPILRNMRFFAWRSRRLGIDSDGLDTATFCSSMPPKSFHHWISSQAIDALGVDPEKMKRLQNGLAVAPSSFGDVYYVATDVLGDVTRKELSERIGLSVSLLDQTGLDEIDTDDRFLKLAGAGLPKDYVRQALHGPLIRKFYDEEHLREIRLRWEASIEVTRIKRNIPRDRFGHEVSFDRPTPDIQRLRTMELEGAFMHKKGRPNIAVSRYWSIEASHPEDFNNSQDWQRLNDQNFERWKSGDNDRLNAFLFEPNCNVAIHEIAVQVRDLQIDNYPFLLGDGCLYLSGNGQARKGKMLPGPSEAHCAAVSLRESSSFYRTVDFPNDLPLFLSEQEVMSIPQHFARHYPHEIKQDDMDSTRVRVRISYRPAEEDQKLHKFIRIPYLDQYPAAPHLLPEGRPWYKAWGEREPLVIRGFSVYFSPRPPTLQVLKDVKLFVVDAEGKPVPGKEVGLMDQTCGGNSESLSLDPGFVRGDLVVEHGEMLSASATLQDGTPTADLAFYILVEIPKSKVDEAFGSPLYYSQGSANLDYLQSDYPKDRIEYVSTPAAFSVLEYVATTTVPPWDKKFGFAKLPACSDDLQDVYNEASKHIFVD